MSYYNQDEEPALAAIAAADTVPVADVSAAGTIKTATMQEVRAWAHNGLTNATASTLTVTAADHAGQVITLNRAGGIASTLPAATGSGNRYVFIIGTTFTSSATIKVVGNDIMVGGAWLAQDAADTVVMFETAADSDTITFDGTTTGGYVGTRVTLIDIATDTWFVEIMGKATGSEATPFSATVS